MIQTPASEVKTNTVCQDPTVRVNQVEFPAQLNVLNIPGLDAILGMDWLVQHAAQIDCATGEVTLTNPKGIRTTYLPDKPHQIKAKVFLAQAPEIGEVYVVSEYPDVFPDELPGMPPDRDIEFAIEVVPGTNPIFKKHYRMTSPELVELKK